MRRWWIRWGLVLGLVACMRRAPSTALISTATPGRTATPTVAVHSPETPIPRISSPTPTVAPATATATRQPTSTPRPPTPTPVPPWTPVPVQRPQPLPEGFQFEGNWITVFRPNLERMTWSEGAFWLTDGQHWIGPWPPDLTTSFWTLWNGRLHFCYWRDGEWFAETATTDVPPICVAAPDTLTSPGNLRRSEGHALYDLKPCGRSGELCAALSLSDGTLSPPLQLPIPESVVQNEVKRFNRVEADGCLSPDRQHALINVYRIGGPESEGVALFQKVVPDFTPEPLVFPSGLYWVDFHSGNVLTAPINAPTWPDQQILAHAMVEQGHFPAAFLPFLQQSLLGPTWAGLSCSPNGRFALATLEIWVPPEKVYLPRDVALHRDFFAGDFQPPQYANLLWLWAIRIEDGTGYPLTLLEELFNLELSDATYGWVPFYALPQDLPQVPLPPRSPEHPPPWDTP
ncbi:hypothetical protein HRbin22_00006 [Candidatus Thermoflexus japonica]|uniref:Uncharacterized protein n=1 Tax=Candidatus Thermoflexus japonica TaxID=2035417 RepID=A0A2H5Y2V5_9CHLR|nr:hypothetical protein HRbin22_00006 [Candidatus Thermoflexus japonica]